MVVFLDKEFNLSIEDIYKSAVDTAINCAEKFSFKIFLIGGVMRLILQMFLNKNIIVQS